MHTTDRQRRIVAARTIGSRLGRRQAAAALVAAALTTAIAATVNFRTAHFGQAPERFTRAVTGDNVRSTAPDAQASANWAGYAVTAPATSYTSVTATWKQPKVSCGPNDAGHASAFWVGLGGYTAGAQALEQTGTDADCDRLDQPTYYGWYELVPAPPVRANLKLAPGDVITTSVNILDGNTVEVQIKDRTRHSSYTKKIPVDSPDTSSADWIAEAPSTCDHDNCVPIPLAHFGSITFSRIAAIGNGVGGTLIHAGWSAEPIELVPDTPTLYITGPTGFRPVTASTAGAAPKAPSADGRDFTISWKPTAPGEGQEPPDHNRTSTRAYQFGERLPE
jgi:hypothetical protein